MDLDARSATSAYLDFAGLAKLRADLAHSRGGAERADGLREAARQFEAVFAHMLVKSMRDASPGDSGLFSSSQTEFYTELFDQQLSVEMTKGEGLGLADLLVSQLSNSVNVEVSRDDGSHARRFLEHAQDSRRLAANLTRDRR